MQNQSGADESAKPKFLSVDTTLSRVIIKSAMAAPYLEKEDELALALRWRDNKDSDALHQLTQSHMRLVIAISTRFRRYNLPMPDLVQEGCVGLLEAAARFDPDREVRFSTYATWWIRASIQDYILRNWSIVRGGTSSAQKSLFFNLRRLRSKLALENQDLTKEEIYQKISGTIGVSVSDVETMDFRFSGSDNSLSAPVQQDDAASVSKMELLKDEAPLQDEKVQEHIDNERRSRWIAQALKVLNARELEIIKTRRLNDDGATLESLGATLGISKERVRQIEARAMQKLRAALLSFNERSAYQT